MCGSARDFKLHGRILGIKGDERASAKVQARSRPSRVTENARDFGGSQIIIGNIETGHTNEREDVLS